MIWVPFGRYNSGRRGGREYPADVGQVFATPEQLAVQDKARHPENADRLGATADPIELLPPLPRRISREAGGVGTGLLQHRADHTGILDVELTFPEALESDVVIAAQHRVALLLRVEHAACGEA